MALERILALTDLSENAAAGVQLADALALRLHAQVVLGYVHTPGGIPREISGAQDAAARLARRAREDEADLRAVAERLVDPRRLAGTETAEAESARAGVLDLVRRVRPDLVCMSTRGRTGVSHLLLGSVAEHTLRAAGVPVAVTKGAPIPAPGRPLRVLVAHDLMHDPAALAGRAAALCAAGDDLIHAHVVESWYYSPSAYGSDIALPLPDVGHLVEAATERLKRIVVPGPRASVEVATGRPGDALLELERKCTPDMIVARTHGRRGFDRLMLGSVCEFLARKAKAAVVVFPKE